MPPRRTGRISFRDQLLRNQQSLDLYAALAGKPTVALNIPPAPKPRAPSAPSSVPLERDVQFEIVVELRRHPMVGLVERVNSGTAVERNADGTQRHIQFHHVFSVRGVKFRAPDLHVTLHGGKRFVIEVKRPGWRGPSGDRELGQKAYIDWVIGLGGYGMFATSWAEVFEELERIRRCDPSRPSAMSSPVPPAADPSREPGRDSEE